MDSRIIMKDKLNKWIRDNEYIIDLIIYRHTRMKENAITDNIRYLWTCRYLEIKQIAEEDGIDFAQIPEETQKGQYDAQLNPFPNDCRRGSPA